MNWKRKVMTMVVLVATLLTVGVAAMPNTLSSPTVFVIAEPENSMTKRRGSVTSVVRTWATPDPGASGSIRCAIIGLIAQLSASEIAPLITLTETVHDHRRRPVDRPPYASALESVLSGNTRRVYAAQWRLFTDWCADLDLRSLPSRLTLSVFRNRQQVLDFSSKHAGHGFGRVSHCVSVTLVVGTSRALVAPLVRLGLKNMTPFHTCDGEIVAILARIVGSQGSHLRDTNETLEP